jgi:hypothetical protein
MSDWISTKDRLPEKDGHYITYSPDCGISLTPFASDLRLIDDIRFTKKAGWYEYDDYWGEYEDVSEVISYWMPLPEPPKPKEG